MRVCAYFSCVRFASALFPFVLPPPGSFLRSLCASFASPFFPSIFRRPFSKRRGAFSTEARVRIFCLCLRIRFFHSPVTPGLSTCPLPEKNVDTRRKRVRPFSIVFGMYLLLLVARLWCWLLRSRSVHNFWVRKFFIVVEF